MFGQRQRSGMVALGLVATLGLSSFAAVSASGAHRPVVTCATLAQGSIGPAVSTIQHVVKTTPDGDYGPMTEAAVKAWQGKHKLKRTGVVDARTWAALPGKIALAACGEQVHGSGVAATCTTLHEGDSGTAVAVLQKAVRAATDGLFGPLTRAAVVSAQRKGKLHGSGIAGPATWAALGLTGTPACQTGGSQPSGPPPKKPRRPKDWKAQRAIAKQVTQLAAELLDAPARKGNPVAVEALQFAKKQRGKPYIWGGVGPKGYDCSGLVMKSFLHAGITLPRVAADQYGAGKPVALDLARPGDLMFYANDLTKPATIHHVVMYLGNGRIIDAPYTGAYVGVRPLWTEGLLPIAVRPTAHLHLPVRPGATGWTVVQLQQDLDRHGAKLTVDGGFGPATVAAVQRWKHKRDLKPTNSVVDLQTWLSF